jgi:hypothetical protein
MIEMKEVEELKDSLFEAQEKRDEFKDTLENIYWTASEVR